MSKERLKIGVVVDQLLPGGVQIAAIEEVKNLCLLGHQAELLILMRKKYSFQFEYLVKNIPHKHLSDSYPWPFRSTIKFPIFSFFSTLHLLSPFLAPRVIEEKSYDFLISHGTTTCFTTLSLWHKKQIPYIAVIHDPMAFILKNVYSKTALRLLFPVLIPLSFYLEKAFVKEALFTAIVSGFHQKFIQGKYQVDPIILPHGCNAARKIPEKRGESILALSRWQKEKRPEFLLEILKELPKAKMTIAGVWTRNLDLEEFKQLVKKLGLQKRVKVISQFKVSDLPNLFRQARVWVHPHFEAFGMGGLEAASFGCPIIIPQGSGVTDLFRHEVDGFFPQKVTLNEYKKYIRRLLNDERLAFKMGENAWWKIKQEYSWQAHTQNLITLIKSQISKVDLPKITAIEIGHAGTVGLSGGDRLFEEMVKRIPRKFTLEVITSPFGSKHWRDSKLKIAIRIIKPNQFEEKNDPFSVFFSYLIRITQTSILLLKRDKNLEIIYSSTNILPDVLPAFIAKLRNPKAIWIARIHHLIPPPPKREGKLLVNIVSYLMQRLSLFCMRRRADLTIVLNKDLYKHLIKIGFSKNRIAVLEAGIDFKRINEYRPKKTELFDGIYLGRLHTAKGVFDTIDIWKKVAARQKDAKLAIIGTGPDYLRNELEAKIKMGGLANSIEILGYLPEDKVYDHLKSAKVFLFTDHEAGWGLAVAEAMSCGLPVVGYDIGILGDIFKDGFRVVKLGDTRKFAQEIIQLLENAIERERLAHQALSQAKDLDWGKTSRRFMNIIKPFTASLQR